MVDPKHVTEDKAGEVTQRQTLIDAARQRRIAAVQAATGLWKFRRDIPKDGVEAQEKLRDEWREFSADSTDIGPHSGNAKISNESDS